MAQVLYGPTFSSELNNAGLAGLPIDWTPYEIFHRNKLTAQQNADLDVVIAAHNPTKQLAKPANVEEFVARWTNAEYLNLLKKRAADIAANKVGNAKNWDQVVLAGGVIDFNRKKVQTLKQDLVTDGVLTQARADEIFS